MTDTPIRGQPIHCEPFADFFRREAEARKAAMQPTQLSLPFDRIVDDTAELLASGISGIGIVGARKPRDRGVDRTAELLASGISGIGIVGGVANAQRRHHLDTTIPPKTK